MALQRVDPDRATPNLLNQKQSAVGSHGHHVNDKPCLHTCLSSTIRTVSWETNYVLVTMKSQAHYLRGMFQKVMLHILAVSRDLQDSSASQIRAAMT